jgi:hypothetical protein
MKKAIQINHFSLTVTGLKLSYTWKGSTTELTLCPFATADLFTNMGFIEALTLSDEPVILFTELKCGQPGTGFCYWCDFVKTFPVNDCMALMIADYRESQKVYQRSMAVIQNLLSPLAA